MLKTLPFNRTFAFTAAALALLARPFCADAATWNWNNVTGAWNLGASWQGGIIPPTNDLTTILNFGGDVGTVVTPTTYSAFNDFPGTFQLNQLTLSGTDANPTTSGLSHLIGGNSIFLGGVNPSVMVSGSANYAVNTPISMGGNLTVGGAGAGTVTFNGKLSGFGDITKQGGSTTLRFGTSPVAPATAAPSENTWMGRLVINAGTVRFNNNAQSGATAIRANPVTFTGAGTLTIKRDNGDETSGFDTSLRIGTLNGTTGSVVATVEGANTRNYDIVITTLSAGIFGGSIVLPAPTGLGNDGGALTIRGSGSQTLTGAISIYKDVVVGDNATLTLSNNASLSTQTTGAVSLAGGDLILDNTNGNFTNGRLRVATPTSTTVETIGGGTLTVIGNALSGTNETTGRLQLGSVSGGGITKPRSGHLVLSVVHRAGGIAPTDLNFQSYSRAQSTTIPQLATVDFAASNATGTVLALGQTGNAPHIRLTQGAFTIPLNNDLLSTTGGAISTGWATINGVDFASYNATNGVISATTAPWTTALPATANALVTGTVVTPSSATPYAVNSVKIAPTAIGQSLNIAGTGHLATTAVLLTGAIDYLISSTGGGGISGAGPRFFNVQSANLTVNASLAAAADQPVVKTGKGILSLTNPGNAAVTGLTAINDGVLRAQAGTSLPGGELRFRGGILEITGGGTFSRDLTFGENGINWSGVEFSQAANGGLGGIVDVDEDRGSGGFSAFGADVTVDLNAPGATVLNWEDPGFIRSNYALILGSPTGTHRVTFADSIVLTAVEALPADTNYNAREIRVVDNPAVSTDWARISGAISGSTQNDMLKTGNGMLELSGINTYAGATIIKEGTLVVTGSSNSSFVHQVYSGATLGGNGSVGLVRVEAGGNLSPGMPVELASIFRTGDLTFLGAPSKLTIGIGGTNAGGEVLNAYDQIIVTGSVNLGGAGLFASFLGSFTASINDIFFLILNDGIDPVSGQFSNGSAITIGGQNFNIFYNADHGTLSTFGGNDVALQLVPEPGSALLLGLGALIAARRRRPAGR